QGLGALWPDFLRSVFAVSRKEIDSDSLELARAVWAAGSKLVITTNYDRVLRWACPDDARDDIEELRIDAPAGLRDVLRGSVNRATVWHLHGSIDEPTRVILLPEPRDGARSAGPATKEFCARASMAVEPTATVGDDHFVRRMPPPSIAAGLALVIISGCVCEPGFTEPQEIEFEPQAELRAIAVGDIPPYYLVDAAGHVTI